VHLVVAANHALDFHLAKAAALTRAGGNYCHCHYAISIQFRPLQPPACPYLHSLPP
jgi:hypothetical protein